MLLLKTFIILLTILNSIQSSCVKYSLRISRGKPVTVKNFQYQASIEYLGYFVCSAVIIHEKFVLSTSDCIPIIKLPRLKVRLGTSYKTKNGQISEIQMVLKTNRIPEKPEYEIAIIELKNAFEISEFIKPIRLAINTDTTLKPGNQGIITGFGRMLSGGYIYPIFLYALQCFDIGLLPKNYCGISSDETIDASFCAGFKDTSKWGCRGDSGSPFVFKSKLYGLVSGGSVCRFNENKQTFISIPYFIRDIALFICQYKNYTLRGVC